VRAFSRGPMKEKYDAHRQAIDEVVELTAIQTAADEAAAAEQVRWRTAALFAFGGAALVGLGLCCWMIARSILTPLRRTVQVMKAVAAGDLSQRLDASRADEVGRMAGSLNQMVASIASNERKLVDAAERERQQAADMLAKVDSLLAVVHAAASGDLTRPVTVSGDDALARIGAAVKQLLDQLRRSMHAIGQHATALSGSANELGTVSTQMSAAAEETSAQSTWSPRPPSR